ncbi:MAG: ECF transporter S component [Eubacteriales bacterium]
MRRETIMKSRKAVLTVVLTGVLGALSFVIQLLEIPLFPAVDFLKLDFSDIPALFMSFTLSPLAGVAVVLIKNVVHLAVSHTAFVGELANFGIGAAYVLIAGLVYGAMGKRKEKWFKSTVLALTAGSLAQIAVATVLNIYVLVPLYRNLYNFDIVMVLGSMSNYLKYLIPFNIIKDTIVSVLFAVLFRYTYKALTKMLDR